jgi:hypothetical protein
MVGGVFEAGLPAGRRRIGAIGSDLDFDEDGLYGSRDWNRTNAVQQPSARLRAFRAVARLILPVAILMTTYTAAYLYNDTKLASFGIPIGDLTLGALLLPTAFFATHITNRRYGPGYAFWQIVASWVIGLALLPVAQGYFGTRAVANPFPDTRTLLAFGAALFVGQVVGIVAFDGTRGRHWWSAPFFGSLWAGIVFCVIFYLAAFAGTGSPWTNAFVVHLGLMSAMAVALLIPYWLLRSVVRPLPGFGGY